MTDSPSSNPSPAPVRTDSRRTVVLCHTLADGSSHLDWMIERSAPIEHRLITFRAPCRPDAVGSHQCTTERLADHRAHYLDFEGRIDGARGSVQRLASGSVVELSASDDRIEAILSWGNTTSRVRAAHFDGERWLLGWEPMESG